MALIFVHVSDIHFGQEKGGTVFIHNDVKDRLIADIKLVLRNINTPKAAGILVTGDIAYGGKETEYKEAAKWLDLAAEAAGCRITDIQVVPGNHDIDRDEISAGGAWLLSEIAAKGEARLDEFLANDRDRALLYARFTSYIPFAEGYNCSMDRSGGLASKKKWDIGPGRTLHFMGLNSALVCKEKDQKGELLLGARQRTLPVIEGTELVVLSHHPLPWLQDSVDAGKFVRSRARVFISGHEHRPKVDVDPIEEGCDLMTLQAGATCPPEAEGPFTYTYNVIEFDWDQEKEKLKVTIYPRAWDDEHKRFEHATAPLGGAGPSYWLSCPYFRNDGAAHLVEMEATAVPDQPNYVVSHPPLEEGAAVPDEYPLLLLRFFRDLNDGERIAVLVKLNGLPADWSDVSSHALERQILDGLVADGRLTEVQAAIDEQKQQRTGKDIIL